MIKKLSILGATMKHVFVINPASGANDHENEIRQILSDCGRLSECEIHVTTTPQNATEFVDTWCRRHREAVRFYACGGDGTLNEVISGIISHPEASVACYPCGSGNDFVKYYGGKENFMDIPALMDAEEVTIDAMRVGDHYSVNVTNFGFDTKVCLAMAKYRHTPVIGGNHAYTAGLINAFFKGMRTDDGYLDICLVNPIGRIGLLKLIKIYERGEHLNDPRFKDLIVYRRAKKLHIEGGDDFAITVDGETFPAPTVDIEILPKSIRLALPEKAKNSVNIHEGRPNL